MGPLFLHPGPPNMADVYVELERMWKRLCRDSGVIFNFLLGHNGDTLFAGTLVSVLCCDMAGMGVMGSG